MLRKITSFQSQVLYITFVNFNLQISLTSISFINKLLFKSRHLEIYFVN